MQQPVTEEQYNELLQKLVTKPKEDPSHPIYNKMYYDYLPSEAKETPQQTDTAADDDDDVIDLSEYAKNKRKKPFKKAHPFVLVHGDRIELQPAVVAEAEAKSEQQGERRAKRSVTEQTPEQRQLGKRQAGEIILLLV